MHFFSTTITTYNILGHFLSHSRFTDLLFFVALWVIFRAINPLNHHHEEKTPKLFSFLPSYFGFREGALYLHTRLTKLLVTSQGGTRKLPPERKAMKVDSRASQVKVLSSSFFLIAREILNFFGTFLDVVFLLHIFLHFQEESGNCCPKTWHGKTFFSEPLYTTSGAGM